MARNSAVQAVCLVLLMLSGQAAAFQLSPMHSARVALAKRAMTPTLRRPHQTGFLPQPRIERAPAARGLRTVVANVAPDVVANDMDEGIYTFNKVVIDTVYDIICFLYPVTGGPRDFAVNHNPQSSTLEPTSNLKPQP
jgi:hypothetical protein